MHGWFGTDHRGMEGLELGESRWSGKLFVLNKQTNKKTREWPRQTFSHLTRAKCFATYEVHTSYNSFNKWTKISSLEITILT